MRATYRQMVEALMDAGQLRVAETLDRTCIHEGLDHLAVSGRQLLGVRDAAIAEPLMTADRDAAELAHDHGGAAMGVAREVRRPRASSRLQGLLERPVA